MNRLVIKRKVQTGIFAFVLVVVFGACSKEKDELLENTWVVFEVYENADATESGYIDYPMLSFMGKDKYVFQRGDYSLTARVKIEKNNKINFETPMRYPSSPSCLYMLTHKINRYEAKWDRRLILSGDQGEKIVLLKKEF